MVEASHPIEATHLPGTATAEQGKVMLDGPNGVAITMTPEAAKGTALSLLAAAEAAKRQEEDV